MRKFWGWMLFLLALFTVGVIRYNTAYASWRGDIAGWVVLLYVGAVILFLFGWYKLALHKAR